MGVRNICTRFVLDLAYQVGGSSFAFKGTRGMSLEAVAGKPRDAQTGRWRTGSRGAPPEGVPRMQRQDAVRGDERAGG